MADEQELESSQPDEELDQPEEGTSSEEEEPLEDEDQPEEESSKVEIDGEELSVEDLKLGFMRDKDYRQKTQELADRRKELEALQASLASVEKKRELTPQEKEAQEVIEKYGLMTESAFEEKMRLQLAKQQDLQEFNSWKLSSGVDEKISSAVYELGKAHPKMTYGEIYNQFWGNSSKKKVVKRKVVGLKPKGGEKRSTGVLTRAKIQEMIKDGTYDKNREKIMEAMKRGEIKS